MRGGGCYLGVPVVHLVGLDGLAAGLAAVVDHGVELRPGAELALPVGDGGERGDHQEGALDPREEDLVEEGDGLDGLTQTHLVSQDTVTTAGRRAHPVSPERETMLAWTDT